MAPPRFLNTFVGYGRRLFEIHMVGGWLVYQLLDRVAGAVVVVGDVVRSLWLVLLVVFVRRKQAELSVSLY